MRSESRLYRVVTWDEQLEREEERYLDGEARLPDAADPDTRQRQLTRMGNAAWGAGLASIMRGDEPGSRTWFERAVQRYHESLESAPPGSWGRYIGSLKARILGDDWAGAEEEARHTLEAGAPEAESPIGRYAAALAALALADDVEARHLAGTIRGRDDFPRTVADAVATLAAADRPGYVLAVEDVLRSFEERDEYLEDVAVADTVMVLQALARRRGLEAELSSPLLPS
jgi:hypothetical protein